MVLGFWLTRSHVSKRPVEAAATQQGCSQSKVPQLCSTTCPWENHQLEEAGPRQFTHVQTHSRYSRVFKCNSCSILFLRCSIYHHILSSMIIYDHILSYIIILYCVVVWVIILIFMSLPEARKAPLSPAWNYQRVATCSHLSLGWCPRETLWKRRPQTSNIYWHEKFSSDGLAKQNQRFEGKGWETRHKFRTVRHDSPSFDHSSCQSQDLLLGKPAPGVSACCRRWRGGMIFSLFAMTNGR
jgi:hypothetical protein